MKRTRKQKVRKNEHDEILRVAGKAIIEKKLMNVHSNSFHSALKYLKDTEVNIMNLLIITGDFNIRDSIWDPSFPHHSVISDDLMILADSYNLDLLIFTH